MGMAVVLLKALFQKGLNSGGFCLQQKEYTNALCILDILASLTTDFPTHCGFNKTKLCDPNVPTLLEILKTDGQK